MQQLVCSFCSCWFLTRLLFALGVSALAIALRFEGSFASNFRLPNQILAPEFGSVELLRASASTTAYGATTAITIDLAFVVSTTTASVPLGWDGMYTARLTAGEIQSSRIESHGTSLPILSTSLAVHENNTVHRADGKEMHLTATQRAHRAHVAPAASPRRTQVCLGCCNDGETEVPCLDVDTCAKHAKSGGKYAFVLAQVGVASWPWLTFLGNVRAQADSLALATNGSIDIVLLIPRKEREAMTCQHHDLLLRYDVRLVEVPWTIPPKMRWTPKKWHPWNRYGWCGPQDLVRLHTLGLEQYDAVAYYDQDIELQGDVGAVFRCASTGYFLSTSGGVGEPLNVGFFALRPDKRLLNAAQIFAVNNSYNETTGWGHSGFAPAEGYFVGAECGQGFFHTLYYKKRSLPAKRALEAAGIHEEVTAAQIDRCIWNYQTSFQCPRKFDCRKVRAHHKPNTRSAWDCTKLALRKGAPAAVPTPSPARIDPSAGCHLMCVHIGQHCKCAAAGEQRFTKQVTVVGVINYCTPTFRGKGNFSIGFNNSTIIVKRLDKHECWCGGSGDEIDVECCIIAKQ